MHFTNLKRNASLNRSYSYAPSSRGADSHAMTATADKSSDGQDVINGSSTVTFTGRGVAPVSDVDLSQVNAGNVRIGTGNNESHHRAEPGRRESVQSRRPE